MVRLQVSLVLIRDVVVNQTKEQHTKIQQVTNRGFTTNIQYWFLSIVMYSRSLCSTSKDVAGDDRAYYAKYNVLVLTKDQTFTRLSCSKFISSKHRLSTKQSLERGLPVQVCRSTKYKGATMRCKKITSPQYLIMSPTRKQ